MYIIVNICFRMFLLSQGKIKKKKKRTDQRHFTSLNSLVADQLIHSGYAIKQKYNILSIAKN